MTHFCDPAGLDLGRWLRPGDRIVIGQACGEPTTLVEALIEQGGAVGGLSAFIATSFSGLLTPRTSQSFALSSMGAIGALRTLTHVISCARCLSRRSTTYSLSRTTRYPLE